MKILRPIVEQWFNEDQKAHVAKCARVCYASNKTDDNAKLLKQCIEKSHFSVFRHQACYYKIPIEKESTIALPISSSNCIDIRTAIVNDNILISCNGESALKVFTQEIEEYKIDAIQALNDKDFIDNLLIRYTFCVNTGIDITRELNRKSPNNICEQSTRYVDFNKKIGINFKECHWMHKCNWWQRLIYKFIAKCDEWFYKISRSKYGLNLPPEDARWCLMLDTMSKVVYTYTVGDWLHILAIRLYDKTGKAHPDCKFVVRQIANFLMDEGYDVEKLINNYYH